MSATGRRTGPSLGGFVVDGDQLDDFKLARAAWRRDLHAVAGLFVDQRATDGRGGRDETLGRIGVFGHDQLEDVLVAGRFDDVQRGSEPGAIFRNPIDVEQRDFGDPLLQHADARLDEPLAFFRRRVLRVLAQIAELAGALDLIRQLEFQLVIERLDLVLELPNQPIFHRGCHATANRTTVLSLPEWPSPAVTTRWSRASATRRAVTRTR